MRKGRLRILSLCLLAALAGAQARAQSETARPTSLRVTVRDPNGAAVVGARVRIVLCKGGARERQTDAAGVALFSEVTASPCRVRVEAAGFESQDLEVAALKDGENELDVRLVVAHIQESVLVGGDRRERSTDPRGDAFTTVLTERQLAELPDDPEEFEEALNRMAGPGAVIRVNGFAGGQLPPKSQIREVRFRQNSYAAEYHEEGFVGIDVYTRTGEDGWHASLDGAFRDESLNARNAFAPRRVPEQSRSFGLTLGGPVRPGRTSLFLSAQGASSFDTQTVFAALPEGRFAEAARRPARMLNLSAALDHKLTRTHYSRVEFQRNASRRDNLGVGNFDLPERAYSAEWSEQLLRLSDAGTFGTRLFNEFRLQARRRADTLRSATDAPTVVVLDAMTRGGAQLDKDARVSVMELADNLDFAFGRHAMRAGILLDAERDDDSETRNARGTFTFASLEDLRSGRPLLFTQRLGSPLVKFSNYQLGGYWQDDFRARKSITLSFGLRYETQTHQSGPFDFAPRVGIAWSPFKDGRTTIRAGAGLFYYWINSDITATALRFDGGRQRDIVVRDPGFPDPFAAGGRIVPPSRIQLSPLIRLPRVSQVSASVERQVGRRMQFRASYTFQRGAHLLRAQDINAPAGDGARADATAGNVVEVESSAISSRHALNATLSTAPTKRLYWLVSYTFAKATSETDGPFSLPANNFDLRSERGPAPDDIRHRLFAAVGMGLFKGLRLAPTFYFSSARPYNVTTGFDDNGDTVINDRPAGVGRNSARGAPQWELNARLSWSAGFGERGAVAGEGAEPIKVSKDDVGSFNSALENAGKRWRVGFYLQARNLLNHTNPINFVGVQTSPFFGQATAALSGRRLEVGTQFSF